MRFLTKHLSPMNGVGGGNRRATWSQGDQRAVSHGKQIVPPRFISVERIHPILRAHLAGPLAQQTRQQIPLRRIRNLIPGAPARSRRRPGPEGVRKRCIKLFEPTIHAPILMPRQLRVHADLHICRGAIKAGRFVALKEGQRRAAPCERAKQCELLRAVAQDTALLESNRSGAAVQRLILSKRPRVARQGGAGSSPW